MGFIVMEKGQLEKIDRLLERYGRILGKVTVIDERGRRW